MAKPIGALVVMLDFTGIARDEFDDWYDTEHIPERQRVPGFLSAQRWLAADGSPLSFALYDLSALEVLKSAPYRAIAGENFSPWSKRIISSCKRVWRYEIEQLLPGAEVSPANAGGLLMFAMNVEAAVEDEFNRWYDTEHVPRLKAVPGVIAARRFQAVLGEQNYLAIYHLRSPAVVESKEWREAVETPWTHSIRPHTTDRMRVVFSSYRRAERSNKN
jgi:hypothetical protein